MWTVALVPWVGWSAAASLLVGASLFQPAARIVDARCPRPGGLVERVVDWWNDAEARGQRRARWVRPTTARVAQPALTMGLSALWAALVWAIAHRAGFTADAFGVVGTVAAAWTVAEAGTFGVLLVFVRPAVRTQLWTARTFRTSWHSGIWWAVPSSTVVYWVLRDLGAAPARQRKQPPGGVP